MCSAPNTYDVSQYIPLVSVFRETEVDTYFIAFELIAMALGISAVFRWVQEEPEPNMQTLPGERHVYLIFSVLHAKKMTWLPWISFLLGVKTCVLDRIVPYLNEQVTP